MEAFNRRAGQPIRAFTALLAAGCCLTTIPERVLGQTFAQVLNLPGGVGARLTAVPIHLKHGLHLFGALGGGATYVNFNSSGKHYQFTADPIWDRVVFAENGGSSWISAFTNEGLPGGGLARPSDVEVSGRNFVFIADAWNDRVLVTTFNGQPQLTAVGSFGLNPSIPVSVAWDGKSAPFDTAADSAGDQHCPASVASRRVRIRSGTAVLGIRDMW